MTATLRRAAETAGWALRAYASSALLIAGVGAAAIAAALLGTGLGHVRLAPIPDAGFAIGWSSLAATPNTLREQAVATLSGILLGLAVAALTVAAMSVLALSVARAAARRSELLVRRAVGATRRQLFTGGLVEGVVMAVAALAVGVPFGVVATSSALDAWPGAAAGGAGIAPIVTALGIVVVVICGSLFPMLTVRRYPRPRSPSAVPPELPVSAIQLGMCLAILVAAAQLARRAGALMGTPGATAASGGEVFELSLSSAPGQRAARYASLLEGLGGSAVLSLGSPGALMGLGTLDFVVTDCGDCAQGGIKTPLRPVPAAVSAVSRDTFSAIGIGVVQGRGITKHDAWGASRVAVVSRRLAAEQFEGGRAVGRRILVGRGDDDGWYRVVGVVENARPRGLGGAFQPPYAVYLSALQQPPRAAELLIRPRANHGALASLSGHGTVVRRRPEASLVRDEAAPVAWFGQLVGLEGWVVLAIALVGTFALMHLWVSALAPELAVRRAVGARRRHVIGHVLLRAAGVAVAGVGIGLWLGEMTSDPLAAVLGGLPARDLALVLRPAAALVSAALAGALLPAWRVARASPALLLD